MFLMYIGINWVNTRKAFFAYVNIIMRRKFVVLLTIFCPFAQFCLTNVLCMLLKSRFYLQSIANGTSVCEVITKQDIYHI